MKLFRMAALLIAALLILITGAVYAFSASSLIRYPRGQAKIAAALGLSAETVARSEDTFTQADLALVEPVSAPCHDAQGRENGYAWGGVLVRNSSPNYWARASGVVIYRDASGQAMGGFQFADIDFPIGRERLLINPRTLNESLSIQLKGPYRSTALTFGNNIQLGDPSPDPASYQTQVEVLEHGATAGDYPAHTVVLSVENSGREKILHAKVIAAVLNSVGEVVDLLYSEPPGRLSAGTRLLPGESRPFRLNSLTKTGACLGKRDPQGYRLLYTLGGLSPYGEPLAWTERVALP